VPGVLPDDTGIRTPDQRLRVFVSSTLAELADERRAASRAISTLRLTPVMFELGASPHPPAELYRAYLAQSDIFIGLYWQSYGQLAPGMEVSGLEHEFELSGEIPRLLYVKTPAPDRDPRLAVLLSRIRQETSYRRFRTAAELGRLVRDDLATLLSERFAAAPRAAIAVGPTRDRRHPLPAPATSLVGREKAIDEVADLVLRRHVRLVTLTGPGGIGKTRLAIAIGERLRQHFGPRTVFVPLAALTRSEMVIGDVGRAAGADLASRDAPLQALVDYFGDGEWLLILDNMEHLVDAARDLDELLASCPGLTILATSLTVLRLRAEWVYPLEALGLPANPADVPLDELAAAPAVALFVERARAVRHDFTLTERNAAAVAEICRRLEGLPLAIELAAARTRLLDPGALLSRLTRSFDALGAGTVDMPERQQTLRATVEWSVSLLDPAELSLLESMATFVDGWTIEAAAVVAGVEEDQVLDLTEALAGHSLIYLDVGDPGGPRSRMLETVREFVVERLAARDDVAEIRRRHADYYRALAEAADRPMRHGHQDEWARRLQVERGNLSDAVRWYMDHDRGPLPDLFRVIAPWAMRPFLGMPIDILRQARSMIDELMPDAGALGAHDRAEVLSAAAVVAFEVGDEDAASAAVARLAPLVEEVDDPYVEAVSRLVTSWSSALAGDFDRGVREASASLELFRGLDEPLWIPVALITLGPQEAAVGDFDEAALHLTEVRDRAERVPNSWLTIAAWVQLGMVALARGRFDDAWASLTEALDLSLAEQQAPSLALCLGALAQLAFAEGEIEQAALLEGAADGLRRRAGLRVWGSARLEAERLALVREALGPERFDEVFAAGFGLSQQDAVTASRRRHGEGVRAS